MGIPIKQSVTLHGTHFRQDALRKVSVGDRVSLVHEPDNPYDCNAISVENIEGVQIGYIPKAVNEKFLKADVRSGTIVTLKRVEDGTDLFCTISFLADSILV